MSPRLLVPVAALALAAVTTAVWASRLPAPRAALSPTATPVIVELFTSEGCSSCPPADAWLAALDRVQPIPGVVVLALEEHVDYWDRLGWRDPFGQAQFGDRQQAYARVLPDRRVYTPEIVIDGRITLQDGDEERAARDLRASAAEPHATVSLARRGDRVAIDVSEIPAAGEDASEVWLAVTESGLTSEVTRGENAGRRLTHAPVVRSLRKIGVARGAFHGEVQVDLRAGATSRGLRVVAFVQLERSRRVVGAGAL